MKARNHGISYCAYDGVHFWRAFTACDVLIPGDPIRQIRTGAREHQELHQGDHSSMAMEWPRDLLHPFFSYNTIQPHQRQPHCFFCPDCPTALLRYEIDPEIEERLWCFDS